MAEEILVVGNGDWQENQILKKLISEANYVIALDGAADRFAGWNEVIGDMDSIKDSSHHKIDGNQNNSDLSKALEKYPVTKVFGIDGGRLDHRLGAFTALFENSSDAILYYEGWRAQRVPNGEKKFEVQRNSKCALFSFGITKSVSIKGVEFELHNQDLKTGTLGLGNTTLEEIVTVSKSDGDLLFIWEENEL